MNAKNLVSLTVAVVFGVLAVTGLMIYFAQGGHIVDHMHAWFGILFTGAAVFHILNNWLSLKAYTVERRTGRIRREFVAPALVAAVFAAGIGFNWPVFSQLANAGKELVRGPRPKPQPLAQPVADSIARAIETAYGQAIMAGDTAALNRLLAESAVLTADDGRQLKRADWLAGKPTARNRTASRVDQTTPVDDNLLLVRGTMTTQPAATGPAERLWYTHVLKKQRDTWQIAAGQTGRADDHQTPPAGE